MGKYFCYNDYQKNEKIMSSEKNKKIDYTIKPKVYFKENYTLEKE